MNEIITILPEIDKLKKISQSIAMLDAIIMPEWEYRYYSFNSNWDKNEMMASMRNGSGDSYFILFCEMGAIIKGFFHESSIVKLNKDPKNFEYFLEQVPKEFENFLKEPAFSINDTTFIFWRKKADKTWNQSKFNGSKDTDSDGSMKLLTILDGNPLTYKKWADAYFEKNLPIESIKAIYTHDEITDDIIKSLNNDLSINNIQNTIQEIGWKKFKA